MKICLTLTAKLAAIVVHAQELFSLDGRVIDEHELCGLINDPEVREWIASLGALAPVKRIK